MCVWQQLSRKNRRRRSRGCAVMLYTYSIVVFCHVEYFFSIVPNRVGFNTLVAGM